MKKFSKNMPIRELINRFKNSKDEQAQMILQLLVSTRQFLLRTSLQFQAARDNAVITPDEIEKLLNTTAKNLKEIIDKPASEGELNAVLQYCKEAIEGQLNKLYEKNDKIAQFYANNKNELKDVLQRKR